MVRFTKQKTCIKKLEERVAKLKKLRIASLSEDDALKTDNYLMICYLVAYKGTYSKLCITGWLAILI